MRKSFSKLISIFLSLVVILASFTACGGNSAEPAIDEVVDAAVKAALEAAVVPTNVTIDADGRQVTVEEAQDMSVQQLLDQAGITLNEGDVLSISPAQTLSGNITVQVLRRNIVTVTVDGEAPVQHTAVLMGGTVAEALEVLGVTLAEDQLVNFDLTQALENGMEIVISTEEEAEEETVPEETESSSSSSSGSSSSGGSSSGGSSSGGSSSGGSSSGGSSSGGSSSGGSSSGGSSSGGSSSGGSSSGGSSSGGSSDSGDSGSSNERTVVSVVYYEDCDGSGHGVKVITYSDGTQEEVPY